MTRHCPQLFACDTDRALHTLSAFFFSPAGLRLHPNKEDCLVLDFVDTIKKHELVTVPTLLGLKPDFDAKCTFP